MSAITVDGMGASCRDRTRERELGLPSDDQVAWDVVRLQVKHGELTRNRICAEHGITPQRLARRIRDHKWGVEPDAGAHDRRIIVGKLMLALEHEIDRIVENRSER